MKVKLLPISLERVEDYLRWFNDTDVNKYLLPTTPKTKTRIINWLNKTIKDNSSIYFSIFLPKQKIYVGHIGLKEINKLNKTAEIGIVVGEKKYWRKGIATNAFRALLRKIKKLKLKKIFAKIHIENKPSISFFSKLGFKKLSSRTKSNDDKNNFLTFVYRLRE